MRLNAPFGARCFLTPCGIHALFPAGYSLNAPFGDRCFLTLSSVKFHSPLSLRLNAPFGARCFLSRYRSSAQADISGGS